LRNDGNPEYALKVNRIRPCGFCGVEKKIVAKGLCNTCYQRYRNNGTPEYVKVRKVCSIDGCDDLVASRGLCGKHYMRWRRHGSTEQTRSNGWGAKESHPLYEIWCWRKRSKPALSPEWEDFWQFVEDVGEKPGPDYRFCVITPTKPVYKDNYEWVEWKEGGSDRGRRTAYAKQWRKDNPAKIKNAELQKMFGISLDDYYDILEKQNSVCAICGKPESVKDNNGKTRSLAVDHDHATGEIRGLLCTNCNKALGHIQDSPALLQKAIAYLTKSLPAESLP